MTCVSFQPLSCWADGLNRR